MSVTQCYWLVHLLLQYCTPYYWVIIWHLKRRHVKKILLTMWT